MMKDNSISKFTQEDFKESLINQFKNNNENLNYAKICLVICNVFYCLNNVSVKIINIYKPDYSFFSFCALRNLIMIFLSYRLLIYKNIEINSFFRIKNYKWFTIRISSNFLALFFLWISLMYLRLGTFTVVFNIYPILLNILSVIFLKEILRIKYIIGCFICFIGCSLFLISEKNDHKSAENDKDTNINFQVFIGCFCCFLCAFFYCFVTISTKYLSKDMNSLQINLYTGIYSFIIPFLFGIFFNFSKFFSDFLDLIFIVLCFVNGMFTFFAFYFVNESIENADLSKVSYLNYLQIVMGIFIGTIFFEEYFGFWDAVGFLIIMGTNIYLTIKK